MSEENGNKTVGVRFPKPLLDAMEKYVSRDSHISSSEFVRSAVRDKLKKEEGVDSFKKVLENLEKEVGEEKSEDEDEGEEEG